jgi:metallo-beta-lactamase class B
MLNKLAVMIFIVTLCPIAAFSQAAAPNGWNDPFPAHKVMDNFYYVGTKELASFLIVTPEGHILMNSNYESSVPLIKANVEKLGFKFSDIKILIAGHAHPDHVEGDAMVKSMTGAQVVVGRLDEAATRNFKPGGKEHPIDRLVDEGEKVTLGGTTLTAHVMPGHTKGCLAWTLDLKEDGKTYHALVECSLNGQFVQSLEQYPGILDDFRATYKKARTLPAEVWVSSHASFYGLPEKYAKLEKRAAGDPNPFFDPQGYLAHVEQYEKSFEAALANPQGQRGRGQRGGQPPPQGQTQPQGQR